jgi:hypothetical protein
MVTGGLPLWPGTSVRPRSTQARRTQFAFTGKGRGLHLVEASKTVSALTRCNRTTTWRSALDTDAACGH